MAKQKVHKGAQNHDTMDLVSLRIKTSVNTRGDTYGNFPQFVVITRSGSFPMKRQ